MERRYGQKFDVFISFQLTLTAIATPPHIPRFSTVTPRSSIVTPRSSIIIPRSSITTELVNARIGKVQASHLLMNSQTSCSVPVTAVADKRTPVKFVTAAVLKVWLLELDSDRVYRLFILPFRTTRLRIALQEKNLNIH